MSTQFPHQAYIALGANLGARENTIRAAVARLSATPEIQMGPASSLIETAPVGGPPGQPAYLNGAAALKTSLRPRGLLDLLLAVEQAFGRDRSREVPHGPRTLDLDLLLFDDLILNEPGLTVPHPRLHERAFVLQPLAEIAPQVRHPRLQRTIQALRDELP